VLVMVVVTDRLQSRPVTDRNGDRNGPNRQNAVLEAGHAGDSFCP
jgi:hypothetical protein